MSKFLKFIVHLAILLTVLDVAALVVPTFTGINTAIITSQEEESNLPLGSVTYAKPVNVSELQVGDSILVQNNSSAYRYRISSIDTENGVFNVYDQTDVEAGEQALTLRNTAPKVIITIGYIGYLVIATQSTEGLIIIGLVVLFLIILFILAELWRKDKRNPDAGELEGGPMAEAAAAEDAAEADAPKTKRQLKKEMKQRAKEEARVDKERAKRDLEEATRQLKEESKARKKEEKRKKKEARKRARTGGFIEDYDPIETKETPAQANPSASEAVQEQAAAEPVIPVEHEDLAADAANEELKKEVAAATMEIPPVEETPEAPEVPAENSMPEAEAQTDGAEPDAADATEPTEPEPVEYKKMAIPVYTAEELIARAQAAGDTPQVVKDDLAGVTLLDYSEILLGDTESQE